MVDSKHQWKAWLYLLPAIILLLIFTVWPIINTVTTAFVYKDVYKPADIHIEKVGEEEYRFFNVDSDSVKRYLGAVEVDGAVHLGYVDASEGSGDVFVYDDGITAWTTVSGESRYFIGAEEGSDADLFEMNDDNVSRLGSSIYPASIFTNAHNPPATVALEEETVYYCGIFKGISEAYRYALATSDDGYLSTTDVLDESAMFWPEACKVGDKNGYRLFVEDESYKAYYVSAAADEDGFVSMRYSESADESAVFVYDTENSAWVCLMEDVEYYLGLDGINRVSVYPVSEISEENAPAPAVLYMHRSNASEAKEQVSLIDGFAYRMGAHRKANGYQTYLTTGESETRGLMLTEDFVNGESFSRLGINNFTCVLTSKGSDFMVCLKNTFILTIITVPISTILALLIAVALNSIKALQKLLQTIFFLPYVTNSIAIGMVFAAMFNIVGINSTSESVGIINNILGALGIERINWINYGAESWASFTALIVYIIWNALPFKILILLGGLQSINKQYYDAAKIDSTPKWRVLTRITVPLLSPMITYIVITSFIGGFKEYSSVVGIFGEAKAVAGGANMNTIVGHIQNHLTVTRDYGLAGAAALMLFAIIFVVTMINLRISKKSTHY